MYRYLKKLRAMQASDLPLSAVILLEISIILVGVMLAFLVNEWRGNRAVDASAEKALAGLAREMRHNHEQAVRTYAYHQAILQEIDSLKEGANESDPAGRIYGYELADWKGMGLPMLRSSTYEMMVSTGVIKDVAFETADALALVYNLQSVLKQLDSASLSRMAADPDIIELSSVKHTFTLYSELLPSLLGVYQLLGKPILEEHGYNLEIEDQALEQLAEHHARDYLQLPEAGHR